MTNKLLKYLGCKLIKRNKTITWCGQEYTLPFKQWDSTHWIQCSKNNVMPVKFTHEEDRNLMIRALNKSNGW